MQFDTFPAAHGGFVPQMQKKDTLLRVLNCPQRPLAFGDKGVCSLLRALLGRLRAAFLCKAFGALKGHA